MLGSTWSEAFQRGGQDGKEATHSGADHHCTAGGRGRSGPRQIREADQPGAGHHRADVLPVEAGVRRDEGEPGTAPEGARARERAPEASSGGLDHARPCDWSCATKRATSGRCRSRTAARCSSTLDPRSSHGTTWTVQGSGSTRSTGTEVGGAGSAVLMSELWVSYGGLMRRRAVLQGVDLRAEAGRITAVVGENGAGKTTLFRTLLGFLEPERGGCFVGERPSGEYRRRWGMGYLPDTTVFPRQWTSRDLLGRGVDLTVAVGRRRRALVDAVRRSGLDASGVSRPLDQLSRGARRRVALAFALIGEPEVIVLDEPFSGLDARARAALREETRTARDRGATVLLASHELAEIERLADRAFILERGRTRPGPQLRSDRASRGKALETALTRGGR